MLAPNRLKARLKAGKPTVGCWVFLSGADSIELLAMCDFDAFIIDHEHIGADLRTLVEQLRGARAGDTACLVRVPSHDPVYIKRVLDGGAHGIVVPMVNTVEEAKTAIAAAKYPVSRSLYFYIKNAQVGKVPGIEEYLAEFTSEKAIGDDGYLVDKGLIPLPDDERAAVIQAVSSLESLQLANN